MKKIKIKIKDKDKDKDKKPKCFNCKDAKNIICPYCYASPLSYKNLKN